MEITKSHVIQAFWLEAASLVNSSHLQLLVTASKKKKTKKKEQKCKNAETPIFHSEIIKINC